MYFTKWMCTDSVKADEWVSGTASPASEMRGERNKA